MKKPTTSPVSPARTLTEIDALARITLSPDLQKLLDKYSGNLDILLLIQIASTLNQMLARSN